MSDMSEDDLVEMMKIHFHLLAETFAELAARNPDKRIIKIRETVNGFEVGCALAAKVKETQ